MSTSANRLARKKELLQEWEEKRIKEEAAQYEADLEAGREIRRLLNLINEVEPEE
jgi:hypothetical protein